MCFIYATHLYGLAFGWIVGSFVNNWVQHSSRTPTGPSWPHCCHLSNKLGEDGVHYVRNGPPKSQVFIPASYTVLEVYLGFLLQVYTEVLVLNYYSVLNLAPCLCRHFDTAQFLWYPFLYWSDLIMCVSMQTASKCDTVSIRLAQLAMAASTFPSLVAALKMVLSDARVPTDPGVKPIENNMSPNVRYYVGMDDPPTLVLCSGNSSLVALQFHSPHEAFDGELAAEKYHLHAKEMVQVSPPSHGLEPAEYRKMNLVFVDDKWYKIQRTVAAAGTRDHYFIAGHQDTALQPAEVCQVVRRFLLEYFGKRDVVANRVVEDQQRAQLPIPLQNWQGFEGVLWWPQEVPILQAVPRRGPGVSQLQPANLCGLRGVPHLTVVGSKRTLCRAVKLLLSRRYRKQS